jgi:hypothetical protein
MKSAGFTDFDGAHRITAPMRATHDTSRFHVEVKHHCAAPKQYTWEIRSAHGLSVEESRDQFASWEEASQAGKYALKDLLQRQQTRAHRT